MLPDSDRHAPNSVFVSAEWKIEHALKLGQGLGSYFGAGFCSICLHQVNRKDGWTVSDTRLAVK